MICCSVVCARVCESAGALTDAAQRNLMSPCFSKNVSYSCDVISVFYSCGTDGSHFVSCLQPTYRRFFFSLTNSPCCRDFLVSQTSMPVRLRVELVLVSLQCLLHKEKQEGAYCIVYGCMCAFKSAAQPDDFGELIAYKRKPKNVWCDENQSKVQR